MEAQLHLRQPCWIQQQIPEQAQQPSSLPSGSAEYAAELRRRATALNAEIARFKATESAASKQQRLRKTAQQLNRSSPSYAARSSSFAVKVEAATSALGQPLE